MKDQYQPMFEKFLLPNLVQLKNRIIMAPMTHGASHPDGSTSETELTYYKRRANGVSIVITAGTWIMPSGGLSGSAGVHRDEMISGLKRLSTVIQEQGAKAVLQIFHGGRKSVPPNGDIVRVVSTIPEDEEESKITQELTDVEIVEIIHAFGEATRRAIEAGFDGIELHGANGCLIQQFFSAHTNRRSDRWGGTLEKRMLFALEIIDVVKRVVREHAKAPFLVGYRISPEEPETLGITMADTLAFIETLANRGLDYLHLSLNDFWSVPRRGIEDSRSRLEIIQERVGRQIPIIGVGLIRTPEDAIRALQTGIPLIALARELIVEPDWIKLIEHGSEEDIQTTLTDKDQNKLVIPDALWAFILDIPGWFPLERSDGR
ncbi:NADH-dependent flavin oxidoreductase [Paenibacillus sp. SI8]|uniref:NADH-dependent flavin oxidoreductase n=1 Tax=unclassified Paenibacillus TaxID=185978 RepID=UPI003467371C